MILLDTNILVYAVKVDDPRHVVSRALIDAVTMGWLYGCVFPQNLLEFYSVTTNPRRVAGALSSNEAFAEISNIRAAFTVVPPEESSLDLLESLISSTDVTGSDVYDVFLVAQMQDAGIDVICTYNTHDFDDLSVRAVTPEEILDDFGISRDGVGLVHDRERPEED